MIIKYEIKIDLTKFENAMKGADWIEYEFEFDVLVDEIEKCLKIAEFRYGDIENSIVGDWIDDDNCLIAVVEADDEKHCIAKTINELNAIKYVNASLY